MVSQSFGKSTGPFITDRVPPHSETSHHVERSTTVRALLLFSSIFVRKTYPTSNTDVLFWMALAKYRAPTAVILFLPSLGQEQ